MPYFSYMDKKVLAIYARKSGNSPTDTSIESQLEGGNKYASEKGYSVLEYVDEKVSGRKGMDTFDIDGSKYDKLHYYERPEFAQMIQDIKNDKIDAVWTYNQDRIERNTNIWIMFSSLIIEKKTIYIVNDLIVDLSDAMTKMMSTIFSVFNEYYSMTTSLRVRPAHKKNALEGRTHGMVAYGYMRDLQSGKYIQNPSEANIVKDIFNYYDKNGLGAYLIADKLNAKGELCPYAKRTGDFKSKKNVYQENRKKENSRWSGSTVSGILKNTIYKGYKYHGKVKIHIENPIVDKVIWNRVNKAIKNNRHGGKRPKHKYLLADILYCGHCENIMIGKRRNDGTDNAYKCSTKQRDVSICKKSRGLSIPKLETFIIRHLFENAGLKDLLLSLPQENNKIDTVKKELDFRNKELKELEVIKSNLNKVINSPKQLENPEAFIDLFNKNANSIDVKKNDIEALKNQLEVLNKTKQRLRIKSTIEGYARGYNFDSMQSAIRSLIESVNLTYLEIGDKREYYLFIKYIGTSTTTMFKTDFKALNFSCVGITQKQQTEVVVSDAVRELLSQNEIGKDLITKYEGEVSDTFTSVGLELFQINLKKDNLVLFN